MPKIGVISDTHIPGRGRRLPQQVFELFEGADLILHAGDVIGSSVLEELERIAPTTAVLGNCDLPELAKTLPPKTTVRMGDLAIGMVHDSGSKEGRRPRLAAAFRGHRVVVFGHSHRPMIEDDGSLLLLNPGSACDPRWAKVPTVAILEIEDGHPQARLVELAR
ncbi:MAG: metallophosphatase family protein [Actinomycetota bacterium]|nr:metallophosphatase family protein [Actinomycetota bacterium]